MVHPPKLSTCVGGPTTPSTSSSVIPGRRAWSRERGTAPPYLQSHQCAKVRQRAATRMPTINRRTVNCTWGNRMTRPRPFGGAHLVPFPRCQPIPVVGPSSTPRNRKRGRPDLHDILGYAPTGMAVRGIGAGIIKPPLGDSAGLRSLLGVRPGKWLISRFPCPHSPVTQRVFRGRYGAAIGRGGDHRDDGLDVLVVNK